MTNRRPIRAVLPAAFALIAWTTVTGARQAAEPVSYVLSAPAPDTQTLVVEARFPAARGPAIDLMLPAWSPGYYVAQDYTASMNGPEATSSDGTPLAVQRIAPNRWRIETGNAKAISLKYTLACRSRFVTGCWVDPALAVINGPSVFITLADGVTREHRVRLDVTGPGWPQSITGLDVVPGAAPHSYIAPDYDTLIDAPIVAGRISVHEADVPGTRLVLADFGELGAWNGRAALDQLRQIVDEHRRMIGGLPFRRYVFLNAFWGGAGGLEHGNSTLLSSRPAPTEPLPGLRWLNFVSHEFFHAINVKRLRPIELGPFDYDRVPQTPSLWVAEGLTTYYGNLAVVRAGLASRDEFLAGQSSQIRSLQTSAGRLRQTLAEASAGVGAAGGSGIGGNRETTVSYYVKGDVVGLLLDARIRRLTGDRRSLDDVMREAYRLYGGARGFQPEEFEAVASRVAGEDLSAWFGRAIRSTEELDYTEMLEWYGLRFIEPGSDDPSRAWGLEPRADATAAQRDRLVRWLSPTPEPRLR